MKNLSILSAFVITVVLSGLIGQASGVEFGEAAAVAVGINLVLAVAGSQFGLLATITPTGLATELSTFFKVNPGLPESWVYSMEVQLHKYARTITKVKGKFHAPHAILEHVVQGFQAEWNALGSTKIKANALDNYRQKVNFPIIPDEIEGTYLAWANEENRKGKDRSIARFCAEELQKKAIDDVSDLSINAQYDAARLDEYGYSLNGIKKILEDGIANTISGAENNPMYLIPINALTPTNIYDQVTSFEQQIPHRLRRHIKRVFMGADKLDDYKIDAENTNGQVTTWTEDKKIKTRLNGYEIVGLDFLSGSNLIFATPDDNLLRLIDLFDMPEVTDVQVENYTVKVFMEFWLGYGFYTNQMVFVSHTGTEQGLYDVTDMQDYYPEEPSGSGN